MGGCPFCYSSEATLIGQLGRTTHVRCRDCGVTYSISEPRLHSEYDVDPYEEV